MQSQDQWHTVEGSVLENVGLQVAQPSRLNGGQFSSRRKHGLVCGRVWVMDEKGGVASRKQRVDEIDVIPKLTRSHE